MLRRIGFAVIFISSLAAINGAGVRLPVAHAATTGTSTGGHCTVSSGSIGLDIIRSDPIILHGPPGLYSCTDELGYQDDFPAANAPDFRSAVLCHRVASDLPVARCSATVCAWICP